MRSLVLPAVLSILVGCGSGLCEPPDAGEASDPTVPILPSPPGGDALDAPCSGLGPCAEIDAARGDSIACAPEEIPRIYQYWCFVDWWNGDEIVVNEKVAVLTMLKDSRQTAKYFEDWFDKNPDSPLQKAQKGKDYQLHRTSAGWCRRA